MPLEQSEELKHLTPAGPKSNQSIRSNNLKINLKY